MPGVSYQDGSRQDGSRHAVCAVLRAHFLFLRVARARACGTLAGAFIVAHTALRAVRAGWDPHCAQHHTLATRATGAGTSTHVVPCACRECVHGGGVCAMRCDPAGMAACSLSVGCAVWRRCVAMVTYTATRDTAFLQVRTGMPAVRVRVCVDVTCGGMMCMWALVQAIGRSTSRWRRATQETVL